MYKTSSGFQIGKLQVERLPALSFRSYLKPVTCNLKLSLCCLVTCLCYLPAAAGNLDAYRAMKGTGTERQVLGLARHTLQSCLLKGVKPAPDFTLAESWPGGQAGVFVTLVKNNAVRACVGGFYPQEAGFLDAVVNTAAESLFLDGRFKPVSSEELTYIRIIISVAGPQTQVADPDSIDFRNYGLLVTQGQKAAVFLPGEAKTTNWGLKAIMKKAGIRNGSETEYYRFETVTFEEE